VIISTAAAIANAVTATMLPSVNSMTPTNTTNVNTCHQIVTRAPKVGTVSCSSAGASLPASPCSADLTVKVIDGASGKVVNEFFAYDASFTGVVYVAVGDLTGDGRADIVAGAGAGGGPHVKVFDGKTFTMTRSFYAFNALFTGGVRVAVDDVNGDGIVDISLAAGPSGGPHVRVLEYDLTELSSQYVFDPAFQDGVFVG
jgi:hypothetical protein